MKKIIAGITAVLMMLLLPVIPVSADTGPKPTVSIDFEGIEEGEYYVTLLSEEESTGPWSVENLSEYGTGEDADVFKKFCEYKDEDGFYFLGNMEECSESNQFIWGYYPPQTFKILIYFPEDDSFAVSGIYERYAFHSYFTAQINGNSVENVTLKEVKAEKTYDYSWELISLICRIVITIVIEVLLALIFKIRKAKPLLAILITNIVTQTILNIALNLIAYYNGSSGLILSYLMMELMVYVIEGCIYGSFIPKLYNGNYTKRKAWMYALLANAVSFIMGYVIDLAVPGIF